MSTGDRDASRRRASATKDTNDGKNKGNCYVFNIYRLEAPSAEERDHQEVWRLLKKKVSSAKF